MVAANFFTTINDPMRFTKKQCDSLSESSCWLLNIDFKVIKSGVYTIMLYGVSGRNVLALSKNANADIIHEAINPAGLPKGIYLICVVSDNNSYAQKVILRQKTLLTFNIRIA